MQSMSSRVSSVEVADGTRSLSHKEIALQAFVGLGDRLSNRRRSPVLPDAAQVATETTAKVSGTCFYAILYLAVPSLIFFAGFVKPLFAVPALILLAIVLARLALVTDFRMRLRGSDGLLVLASLAWTVLAGITPPFGQNDDWLKHYALLNFLNAHQWPPALDGEYLRYSLGWYLPPALATKLAGLHDSDTIVALWTGLGAFLALRLVTGSYATARRVAAATLIFVFFSGLDVLGGLMMNRGSLPANHLEWWVGWGQISSNMTSFFWVQQHALAGWIVVGLMLRMKAEKLVSLSVLLFGLVAFWSPFVAIGWVPFAAWLLTQAPRLRAVFSLDNILAAIPAVLLLSYLLSGTAQLKHEPIWEFRPLFTWASLPLFMLLEWGVFVVAILYAGTRHKTLLLVASATLAALSFYRFGEYNDLLMRGSIPAIAFLAVISTEALLTAPLERTAPLLMLVAIGAMTGAAEIARDVSKPHANSALIKFEEYARVLGVHRAQYLAPKPFILRSRLRQ
jgi:hypothetical protein